jgi:hypothetical protein
MNATFQNRKEAHDYAARRRKEGKNVCVKRFEGVGTVPFKGITYFRYWMVLVAKA